MNEPEQLPSQKGGSDVWIVFKRTLGVVVILIATVCFVANAAGLVGVWIARRPACDTVTALSTLVNRKLGNLDQALAQVGARADDGRRALARINDAANKLGDRLEEGKPLSTGLVNAVENDLAPKITKARAQAVALHDAAVSVNATLETLDSLGFIKVPTFGEELNAVSERVGDVQSDVQELRATIDEARTAGSANLAAAITARTNKIDNALTQIKSAAVKYQATVVQKQQRVTNLSNTLLRLINLLVLSLTTLFLVVAVGQILLVYVCWQYVRRGKFPLLRVD